MTGPQLQSHAAPSPRAFRLLAAALLLAATLAAVWLIADEFLARAVFRWNGSRLAPIAGWLQGYKLYYRLGEGPVMNTIYGPFAFYPYAPAALLHSPTAAMFSGQGISVALFLAPWLLWSLTGGQDRPRRRAWTLLAGAPFFLFATARTRGLAYSAVNIHSDAPAIFFMGLALLALERAPRPLPAFRLALAAFLAACSLWAKQTLVPLPFAMTLYLFLRGERLRSLVFFLAVGVAGALLGLLFGALHGFEALAFNLFEVPRGHPWRQSYAVSFDMYRNMPIVWTICAVAIAHLGIQLRRTITGRQTGIAWAEPWTLHALAWALLTPVGLLGVSKIGGWDNSLSPALYAGMLMILTIGRRYMEDETGWDGPSFAVASATAAVALAALVGAARLDREALRTRWRDRATNPHQQAFDFAKASDARVYFSMAPLGILQATGKLYHFDYGLEDLSLGGYELDAEALRRWMPETIDYIAVRFPKPLPREKIFILRYFPEFTLETSLPGLEGWQVFAKPRQAR